MHIRRFICLLCSVIAFGAYAQEVAPTEATPEPQSFAEALHAAGVNLTAGPAKVKLGQVAEVTLPENYHFVGDDSLEKFYELTHNVVAGNEVGVLIAPAGWMLFFDYEDIGYVKDDDKDELDADALFESMTDSQDAANESRKARGWDEMKLQGWALQPHYDTKTNHLKWAINLSSSQDGYQEVWINENIRLLGRGGVMNVTLVSETEGFAQAQIEADKVLTEKFSYVSGSKYSEFKAGDKIATVGLAALVLGGAAAVAAKTGLLAQLGVFFAKAWKFIVVAFVAFAGFVGKIWNKITGAKSPPSEEE